MPKRFDHKATSYLVQPCITLPIYCIVYYATGVNHNSCSVLEELFCFFMMLIEFNWVSVIVRLSNATSSANCWGTIEQQNCKFF